jgi:hypothetical protein
MLFTDAEASAAEFVDNGSAPEFFVHGLHDVDVFGSTSRAAFFNFKRTPQGILYRDASLFMMIPTDAVTPGAVLALKRVGWREALPIAGHVMRSLLSH